MLWLNELIHKNKAVLKKKMHIKNLCICPSPCSGSLDEDYRPLILALHVGLCKTQHGSGDIKQEPREISGKHIRGGKTGETRKEMGQSRVKEK